MSLDTSGRPHEIVAMRIGDIKIKKTGDNKIYTEMDLGRSGKTKA